jgi:hypothetical protein
MLRYQQEGWEDQGVDNRDRNHANAKAAVVVIEERSQNITKSRGDEKEGARHHERRPLQADRA